MVQQRVPGMLLYQRDCGKTAICLLEDYAELSQIKYTRSLRPSDPTAEPCGSTFSDNIR